ncbi:MAG: FG-GAP repeat protein [Planctomycetota bacterium]
MKIAALSPLLTCLLAGDALAQEILLNVPGPDGQALGGFSRVLVGLSDIDGDGLDDFLAGNSAEWGSAVDEGLIQVFSGGSGALLFDYRGSIFENIGRGAGAFDDLDGDGVDDFWFSTERNPTDNREGIQVFSGAAGAMIQTFRGLGSEDLGDAAASLGDLDGDGVPDLALAYSSITQVPLLAGGVRVVSGATGSQLLVIPGTQSGEALGSSLAAVPDLTGDGKPEILAGATGVDTNGLGCGAVRIYSSSDGSQLAEFLGPLQGAEFGRQAIHAGDVNGDGSPDIAISSRAGGQPGNNREAVFVYSTADGSVLHRFDGDEPDIGFGWAFGAGGDVDGDGSSDIAVGAFRDDKAGHNAGAMTLFSGASGEETFRVEGGAGDVMGIGVAIGGDLNGDGYEDVLVGAGFETNPLTQFRNGSVYVLGHEHVEGNPLCFGQENSTGAAALLSPTSASGFAASSNDLQLEVTDLPQQSLGYFIVSQSSDIVLRPGDSAGTLCIAGRSIGRFAGDVLNSGSIGAVSFQPDVTSIPLASASGQGTVSATAGDLFNFQYWYRDVTAARTSNFSSASCVVFQ